MAPVRLKQRQIRLILNRGDFVRYDKKNGFVALMLAQYDGSWLRR